MAGGQFADAVPLGLCAQAIIGITNGLMCLFHKTITGSNIGNNVAVVFSKFGVYLAMFLCFAAGEGQWAMSFFLQGTMWMVMGYGGRWFRYTIVSQGTHNPAAILSYSLGFLLADVALAVAFCLTKRSAADIIQIFANLLQPIALIIIVMFNFGDTPRGQGEEAGSILEGILLLIYGVVSYVMALIRYIECSCGKSGESGGRTRAKTETSSSSSEAGSSLSSSTSSSSSSSSSSASD